MTELDERKPETMVRKIKWDGSRIKLSFEIRYPIPGTDEQRTDEYDLKSIDRPTPAFIDALNALGADVDEWLEMPSNWSSNLIIRGVSLSWTDDIMGAVITALKPLNDSRAPFVVNTPHKPAMPFYERFIKGQRKQMQEWAERQMMIDGGRPVTRTMIGQVIGQRRLLNPEPEERELQKEHDMDAAVEKPGFLTNYVSCCCRANIKITYCEWCQEDPQFCPACKGSGITKLECTGCGAIIKSRKEIVTND